jgi:hypothetical protein
MSDLQNAAAACAGGPDTGPCAQFQIAEQFAEQMQPCFACLQPFAFSTQAFEGSNLEVTEPYLMQAAIRMCAAPFLDATCNHNSACIADCLAEACDSCRNSAACQAQAQSGTCAAFFADDQCFSLALDGAAALCNPAAYGNFGSWLQAVGTQYCAE